MASTDNNSKGLLIVLVNDEEQYSFWSKAKNVPTGMASGVHVQYGIMTAFRWNQCHVVVETGEPDGPEYAVLHTEVFSQTDSRTQQYPRARWLHRDGAPIPRSRTIFMFEWPGSPPSSQGCQPECCGSFPMTSHSPRN